jgi:hypothetical protein
MGWHGLDPVTQICPSAVLPPENPFTIHAAVPFAAANEVVGLRLREMEEMSVITTLAEELGLALLRAWIVTMPPAGRICGVVYVVLFGETCEFKIVPTVAFPSTTPFTSQVTVVSTAPVTTAWKFCVLPSSTEADGGVTATFITAATEIESEAAFVGSATGVATIFKFADDGGIAGAEYTPACVSVPQEFAVHPVPAMLQEIAWLGFEFAAGEIVAA